MTPKAFIEKALTHYTAHLAAETQQFGILAISDALIRRSAGLVDDARNMWEDMSQQSGLNLYVNYDNRGNQTIYAILSKEPIPRPGQTHMLWSIVQELKIGSESYKIESLRLYDGPYKIDVPPSVCEG